MLKIVAVPADRDPARSAEKDVAQPDSFEGVYERYGGRVLNLAYRMTGNEEVARDLAQDVWIKVLQHFDRFEARSDVYTWIHRITVNHVLNHLKRERRVRWMRFLDQSVGDALRDEGVVRELEHPTTPGADHSVESDERARRVWDAIQTLDPKYRIPLVLHHYEEMSYQQVADTLQLSMPAVETRIHRARKQLIEVLGPLLEAL
jgi:RNA polymerase sigma-70 factor (ECF subfamily)